MAPSDQEIEDALSRGTYTLYAEDPLAVTVNAVRKHVEAKLHLDDGFLSNDTWKYRSKALIKDYGEKSSDGWVPDEPTVKKSTNGTKRSSSESEMPKPKRRKRAETNKAVKHDVESSEEETKLSKKLIKRPVKKRTVESDSDDLSEKKSKQARTMESDNDADVKAKVREDSEDTKDLPIRSASDDETKPKRESTKDSIDPHTEEKDSKLEPPSDSEDYSDVIDEAPKPKTKRGKKESAPKPKRAKKEAAPKPTSDDPHDAEIKKLQSHLIKCGVRKLWHNELKQHGSDGRAKIRHLKKMLADVGMEGRFSEARATEIKELRELQADVEATQEMNQLWGSVSAGRASRSQAGNTKTKVLESEGEQDEDEVADEGEDEEESDAKPKGAIAARRRQARGDLAFLGDDSDSD